MKPENASQNREAKEVHGRGIRTKARGGEDTNRDDRVSTRGLRDQEENGEAVVSWPEEGYVGETPHPIYHGDDLSP